MVSRTAVFAKPWDTPFRFMLVTMIVCLLESLLALWFNMKNYGISTADFLMLFLWPSVLLVEVIFYRVVRRRIKERKFVWAHLILSLFSFAVLPLLYIGALFFSYLVIPSSPVLKSLFRVQMYSYWAGVIIGHIFFVIVIVQCFSAQKPQQPNDDNDLLSEIAM